jgi:hypothetical protein
MQLRPRKKDFSKPTKRANEIPDAFRSFRQALVADAVLRRTSFMSMPPPKQGTDMGITPHHVLGFILVVSTRHYEHTWAQKASSPTAPTRGREIHTGRRSMWAKNSWEPRSDKPISVQSGYLPLDRYRISGFFRRGTTCQVDRLQGGSRRGATVYFQDLKDNT